MRLNTRLLGLALFGLGGVAGAAPLTLYDDFSSGYLDAAKWIAPPICGHSALECAREVQGGTLRFASKAHSPKVSDGGIAYDGVGLLFPNPQTVNTISFQFKVADYVSVGCPANAEAAHPQLLLSGNYFNSGSGASQDDVQAYFMVERRSDNNFDPPNTLRVAGFMSSNGVFFNNVDLGTVQVGETGTGTLRWDHAKHRFVVSLKRNRTLPAIVQAAMPYTLADLLAPVTPRKGIGLNSYTPNCIAGSGRVGMDVSLDKITKD